MFYPPAAPSYLPPARRRVELQVAPIRVQTFHLHLINHLLAAVVTSRTSRLEICGAAPDEVHDTVDMGVVETVSESSSMEEEQHQPALMECLSSYGAVEAAEDETDTLVAEAGCSLFEEKPVDVVSLDQLQEAAPVYAEFEWDRAPSYEDFASGAPPEPLFETRRVSLNHVIHRPPSLEVLAARIGAKPSSAVRTSRLPLLARLSSRVASNASATFAEPASAA
ncbi:hypothetical protein FB451DRAFT_1284908 [Mycena latifolia]|nr:hypothetical protein FB451DRAFT_1284908 [Mycena latifolia]